MNNFTEENRSYLNSLPKNYRKYTRKLRSGNYRNNATFRANEANIQAKIGNTSKKQTTRNTFSRLHGLMRKQRGLNRIHTTSSPVHVNNHENSISNYNSNNESNNSASNFNSNINIDTDTIEHFFDAILDDNARQVRSLLGRYPDLIQVPMQQYYTPLMLAAREGMSNALRALIPFTYDINQRMKPWKETALYLASKNVTRNSNKDENICHEMVKMLLEAGADTDLPDWQGYTPLMAAARHTSTDTAKALLSDGAYMGAKNKYGETALSMAKEEGNREMIRLLRNA